MTTVVSCSSTCATRPGLVQVVIDPESPGGASAPRLRSEYVVRITGEVRARPEGTVNPDLPTGAVEIAAGEVEVLAESEPPPFPLDGAPPTSTRASDSSTATSTCAVRRCSATCDCAATVNAALRHSMEAQRFVEVETPMLIAVDT